MGFSINLLNLAFKNLGRHKRSTFFSTLAVVVAVFFYVIVDAFTAGKIHSIEQSLINYESGAVNVYTKEYYENRLDMPLYESFKNYEQLYNILNKEGYSSTAQVKFKGSIVSSEEEIPLLFIGIDIDHEKTVFFNHNYVIEGSYPANNEFGLVLGKKIAQEIKVGIGDVVKVKTMIDKKTEEGKIVHIHQLLLLKVAAIIQTPNPAVNTEVGYIPLGVLQDYKGLMLEGAVTNLCIRKKGATETEIVSPIETSSVIKTVFEKYKKEIDQSLYNNLVFINWNEEAKEAINLARANQFFYMFIIIIILVLALLGISNTMVIAILQRMKEIGMLHSMGMHNSEILRLFIYESGLIGFIGSVIGVIFGSLINIFMIYKGIDMTETIETFGDIAAKTYIIKSVWSPAGIISSLIFPALFCILLAYLPISKILKKPIIEVINLNKH